MKTRDRRIYIILIIIVILLGLGSRRFSEFLPDWLANYAGDTLWALMVFLAIGFLFKKRSVKWVGVSALLFSIIIEISQLYHAPWIDGIRKNPFCALILGYGFLWSDLVCYVVGVSVGILLDQYILYRDID